MPSHSYIRSPHLNSPPFPVPNPPTYSSSSSSSLVLHRRSPQYPAVLPKLGQPLLHVIETSLAHLGQLPKNYDQGGLVRPRLPHSLPKPLRNPRFLSLTLFPVLNLVQLPLLAFNGLRYGRWRCEVCLRYFTKSLRAMVFMQTVYSTVVRGYSNWVCDKGVNLTNKERV